MSVRVVVKGRTDEEGERVNVEGRGREVSSCESRLCFMELVSSDGVKHRLFFKNSYSKIL